ncbi:MAG: 50S ribosomal protein L6 [Candidatus Woesearchaeota archaeon]|nr:50S ribosomal protein L6 [Candidatus Woesearchaeota archaeon]
MKKTTLTTELDIPAGITAQVAHESRVTVKGPKGEITREWKHPYIKIRSENNKVIIHSSQATAREKKMINTIDSHIANMLRGAAEGHEYRLKICSGHFPMTVTAGATEFSVKNFLGEKNPRILKFDSSIKVKVEGQEVVVEGAAIEPVSQCAANIEKLTVVKNRDRRIFQDGIYITTKDGKAIE